MLDVQINKSLSHFDLQANFQAGNEIVVFFGSSGAGKSTILNCIAGLVKPSAGLIQLNDRVLFESGKVNIPIQQRKIGYLFQDYALFPHMTVWKNIAYGMKNESLTKKIITELRIDHLADQYPHEISGGEKQRVALARALATEPELLLLDEPFSALDDQTRKKAHEQLLNLHNQWDIPIILVTHNFKEAKLLGDKIIYIDKGKISLNKPPRKISHLHE